MGSTSTVGSLRTPGAGPELRSVLGIPPDAFVVGWLGRMTEIKRADVLLRAFAAISDQSHLLLAGDGPLRPSLEGLARELGVGSRVHFAGFRDDVGAVYAACDVVALTSANEGTPVSVIEALAAGVPVVSTNVGGVADIVDDGRTGLLAPPGDVAAIASGLRRLADHPEERLRMGESARATVIERYSVSRLVRDVDALYRELLGQAKAPQPRRKRALPPTLAGASIARAERRLRILLVSQYFPPEIGATQSRMQAFAEYLARRGHDVTVIAEFPNHPLGVIPDEYRGRLVEIDRSNRVQGDPGLGAHELGEDADDAPLLLHVVHGDGGRGRAARPAGPTSCSRRRRRCSPAWPGGRSPG